MVISFSDEKGGVTRHPFAPTWPLEMLSTTTLVEESGKTKLTIHCSPLNPTDEEQKTFDTSHDRMKQARLVGNARSTRRASGESVNGNAMQMGKLDLKKLKAAYAGR